MGPVDSRSAVEQLRPEAVEAVGAVEALKVRPLPRTGLARTGLAAETFGVAADPAVVAPVVAPVVATVVAPVVAVIAVVDSSVDSEPDTAADQEG